MRAVLIFIFLCVHQGSLVWADHPTEGALSLEALVQEALANSPEIKAAESGFEVAVSRHQSTWGDFSPEVSIEGGPLTTRFGSESHSGTAAYGKAEWNLYRGGKDVAERSKREIEKKLAEKKLVQVKAKVAREVARLYYEMAFTLESVAIHKQALETNQEQMKLARTKKSAGFTSEADVIEFELREARLRSDTKDLLQQKESQSRELAALLGRAGGSGDLAVMGHLKKSQELPNKNRMIQAIAEASPEVIEAKAALDISQKDKVAARAGFLPKLDLEAKYGKIANDERVFPENDNYSVRVMLKIPLFSGFSDVHQMASARSLVSKGEAEVTKQSLATKAEAETLYSKLVTIQQRLDLEEKTLSRSEQYYKITLGEYRRGVKNSPDMVGAAERVLNSKIRNLEFRRDYQISLLKLLALVGAAPGDKFWLSANGAGL